MRTIAIFTALLLCAASQAQTVDICDRTRQVRYAIMEAVGADHCDAVDSDRLAALEILDLESKQVTALQAWDFDGLASLRHLDLHGNLLTALPESAFDGLTSLERLHLYENQLTALPDGVFDGLTSLQSLNLSGNRLTTLPDGMFDGLASLEWLYLHRNRLTTLPNGVFDGLTSLQQLWLDENRLTTLPDGVFDGLTSLFVLDLSENQLTTLPDSAFNGLASLAVLWLDGNELTTLPAGAFDGLAKLVRLWLYGNQLTSLPAGVFNGLTSLERLDLRHNHLVGLTRDDPLFAGFSSDVVVRLSGQTEPPETPPPSRLAAAVPLMLSSSGPTRQGFVRIVNESGGSGSVRIFAFDDGGHAPDPIEILLGAGQVVHFNSNDLEYGNPNKGIEVGVGGPVQGDWRLDVETDLAVRVLAFVRHGDGFLTAMHDVLPRDADGRLVAHTFNPGGNMNQASSLRLVNTGANDEGVSISGVDDRGGNAGPVTLTRLRANPAPCRRSTLRTERRG